MKFRFATCPDFRFSPKFRRPRTFRQFRRLLSMAAVMAALLTSAALVRAETLAGTVMNATTGKPAAGDDVVLLTLSQGMQESGRTKTDAQGKFTFNITDGGAHLVRVNHQGVNYFPAGGAIRPGATSTEIQVFDSARKLDGVVENVRVMRVQADQNALQVIELISLGNSSTPPRALMSDRTYEFFLPQGAQIDESAAQGPGGMPVNSAPVPDDKVKGKYYFIFPIRPGETRFQIAYHLPYGGEATLKPRLTGRLEHFAVIMPKTMEFSAKSQGVFSPVNEDNSQATLQVATRVTPDKDLTFRVAGTGILADQQAGQGQGGQQAAEGGGMGGAAARPGGGLGTPEGTPDPLHKYRWAILAGCLALLAAGGGWAATRNQPTPEPAEAPARASKSRPSTQRPVPEPASQSASLLEGLKEELFQLEVERQQGRISEQEYLKTKSALDQTLQRALSRVKSKQS